jgi:hypothetical protein
MFKVLLMLLLLLVAAAGSASAATRYVWQDSPSPGPPYTSWTSAAHVIQDAVDAALAGDEIVVTNGTYVTGGRAVGTNVVVNRVAVDKPLTVRSVNGPQFTAIKGYQVPGTTNGDGAIRCVYLADGASLSGFTLTNGATRRDGDDEHDRSGGGVWCESTNAVVSNCVLTGNSAHMDGGGAYLGTLNNCSVTYNTANYQGGGASDSTLNNCTLTSNSAPYGGGAHGAYRGTLNNCVLTGNRAGAGGGADAATLNNCTLTGNSANGGGGALLCRLNNCTLTGNSAEQGGGVGGAWDLPSTLNNCIVYFNDALEGANYELGIRLNYCCTTPMPSEGVGNITNEPAFVDAAAGNYRLRPDSPCIDAGTNLSAIVSNDLDGRPRPVDGNGDGLAAFDIGAFEYRALLVWQGSPSPAPPYATWATAATNIQDAVDAALAGDEIVVTNGTYATGGRAVGTNVLVNRVAVDKPLTLRSVNGPEVTIIQGYQVPGTTNGDGAIRCVYLADGANLSGFTLTNGATRNVADGDPKNGESGGGGLWCESQGASVSNCVLAGNSASQTGGGVYDGALDNCTLTGNSVFAGFGGGAYKSTLNNCTLTRNRSGGGGGACLATLSNCTLQGNSAEDGGGASGGRLDNCTLTGNSARFGGGAASYFEAPCTLNNCTLTGNSARDAGGGAAWSILNNCIVYFNTAAVGPNYLNSQTEFRLNYCCTTPLPMDGVGNIDLDPQLADVSHLSAGSPCRGAGSVVYTGGTDIDGEPWSMPPSMGCDEFHVGAVTGSLGVGIAAAYTNVAVGYPVELTALIEGRTSASVWDFGAGVVVSNRPYVTHAWSTAGDHEIALRGYNESHPEGVSATQIVHVVAQMVHYVAIGSANPLPPYTSWATAATTIQDAVDAASDAGAFVLVTNGIYAAGGRVVHGTMTNRVVVDRPLNLRSVNGPDFTVIQGYQVPGTTNGDAAIRCVYLGSGASLSGFTLTYGATRVAGDWEREQTGGGVWCESVAAVVSNCAISGNSAEDGGGAFQGTLNNCTLTGNSASRTSLTPGAPSPTGSGGGAAWAVLNNCTVSGNSASYGGGVSLAYRLSFNSLDNCIIYFNTATAEPNYLLSFGLNHCCTTPMPANGLGNITNAPLFVDYAGGNLRLQSNSPCINAGLNAYAPGSTDLDGLPRIVSGEVDIGAYEFQGTGSVISYAWLQQYGLPTDGSADFTDPDTDGHTTWQEWRCQTSPTNALSVLRLLSATPAGTNVTVSWQSVAGVSYFLERSTNLWASPPFTLLAPNLPGQPGTTSYTDTNAATAPRLFYRVGVGY